MNGMQLLVGYSWGNALSQYKRMSPGAQTRSLGPSRKRNVSLGVVCLFWLHKFRRFASISVCIVVVS